MQVKLSVARKRDFLKVTGYRILIKYSTNKTVYTRSSLFSISEWFAVWLKHTVNYLDNENHNYEQHLVQGIQLQTWTPKKSKISPSNSCWLLQLESTQAGGHSLVAVVLFFLQYCFCERILTVLNRKNGIKVYMLYHKGATVNVQIFVVTIFRGLNFRGD